MTGYVKIALFAMIVMFADSAALWGAGTDIPDVPGWSGGQTRISVLDTVSGPHGEWAERDLRLPDGSQITVTLMSVDGPKFFYPPKVGISDADGPFGDGAVYETFSLDGMTAIFEDRPLIGLSLAILGEKYTMTIESRSVGVGRDRLISCARSLIEALGKR